jgi:hypothetical protein
LITAAARSSMLQPISAARRSIKMMAVFIEQLT